ncbi:RDD family protein [Streptomyces cinnabarinus]|uniref:RDD family protein n=1 Tax=Streptomyces cinnabarinus TaxID=67287 RepID=A0ABY7KEN3_9ACTN|nr:RDD family protein [Streptomyces cinnabarinus]WAZ22055.1 RDD family protein [Streptomyces cinnabarinus]
MSAPTPAPGDDRPREGYYPDPSIPGYVRYWNGASWVPGTSRPAPTDGEPLAPPPGPNQASPAGPVEETGPHFFDEDPAGEPAAAQGRSQHGSRPEPASAWGADRSRQTGFGGDQDRRVSWGAPDPRTPDPRTPAPAEGATQSTDGTATIPPADSDPSDTGAAANNTFVFRRPIPGPAALDAAAQDAPADEGTMTFRAVSPRTGRPDGAPAAQQGRTPGSPAGPGASGSGGTGVAGAAAAAPQGRGFGAGKAAADRAAAQAQQGAQVAAPTALSGPQAAPAVPAQSGPPSAPQTPAQGGAQAATPVTSGPGGGQPSWAQQVHRLAGDEDQPVVPWKPPVEDPFQAVVRRQAAARPASLGKRLAARLLDTVVLLGVTAAAAVPLGTRAMDHVDEKIDAAKLSGETVTVWLLDGTTSAYLGIVLAVLLLFGTLYEALPTAKWGRTLGKKLFGLEVRDIEGHEPPTFGGALRRWLVYSVPVLLVIGVVGVLWCLFDKPWRQCWHDKAAGTFVAG